MLLKFNCCKFVLIYAEGFKRQYLHFHFGPDQFFIKLLKTEIESVDDNFKHVPYSIFSNKVSTVLQT